MAANLWESLDVKGLWYELLVPVTTNLQYRHKPSQAVMFACPFSVSGHLLSLKLTASLQGYTPFLLGPGLFSGANLLLVPGSVFSLFWISGRHSDDSPKDDAIYVEDLEARKLCTVHPQKTNKKKVRKNGWFEGYTLEI